MTETPNTTPPVAPAATPPSEPPAGGEPTMLPDDHPLVKAFEAKKARLAEAEARLAEIDNANKTEAQKQAEALANLQKENETLKAATLRAEVAATKGVPANLISGSTKEELEAAADALLAFKGTPGQQLPGNQKPGGPVGSPPPAEESREDRKKRLLEAQ